MNGTTVHASHARLSATFSASAKRRKYSVSDTLDPARARRAARRPCRSLASSAAHADRRASTPRQPAAALARLPWSAARLRARAALWVIGAPPRCPRRCGRARTVPALNRLDGGLPEAEDLAGHPPALAQAAPGVPPAALAREELRALRLLPGTSSVAASGATALVAPLARTLQRQQRAGRASRRAAQRRARRRARVPGWPAAASALGGRCRLCAAPCCACCRLAAAAAAAAPPPRRAALPAPGAPAAPFIDAVSKGGRKQCARMALWCALCLAHQQHGGLCIASFGTGLRQHCASPAWAEL